MINFYPEAMAKGVASLADLALGARFIQMRKFGMAFRMRTYGAARERGNLAQFGPIHEQFMGEGAQIEPSLPCQRDGFLCSSLFRGAP